MDNCLFILIYRRFAYWRWWFSTSHIVRDCQRVMVHIQNRACQDDTIAAMWCSSVHGSRWWRHGADLPASLAVIYNQHNWSFNYSIAIVILEWNMEISKNHHWHCFFVWHANVLLQKRGGPPGLDLLIYGWKVNIGNKNGDLLKKNQKKKKKKRQKIVPSGITNQYYL